MPLFLTQDFSEERKLPCCRSPKALTGQPNQGMTHEAWYLDSKQMQGPNREQWGVAFPHPSASRHPRSEPPSPRSISHSRSICPRNSQKNQRRKFSLGGGRAGKTPPPPEDLQMENTEKRRSQAGEGIQISTEMGKSSSSAHASKSLSLAGKEMSRLPSGGL